MDNLTQTMDKAVLKRIITSDAGNRWKNNLQELKTNDTFFTKLTAYTAIGKKSF